MKCIICRTESEDGLCSLECYENFQNRFQEMMNENYNISMPVYQAPNEDGTPHIIAKTIVWTKDESSEVNVFMLSDGTCKLPEKEIKKFKTMKCLICKKESKASVCSPECFAVYHKNFDKIMAEQFNFVDDPNPVPNKDGTPHVVATCHLCDKNGVTWIKIHKRSDGSVFIPDEEIAKLK